MIIFWKEIGIMWAVLIFIAIVLRIFSTSVYKKIVKSYEEKKYDLVIKLSNQYKFLVLGVKGQHIYLIQGYSCIENKNFETAANIFSKIKQDKLIAIKYYWLCFICLRKEDLKEASKFFDLFNSSLNKSINDYPYGIKRNALAGSLYCYHSKIEEGIKILSEVLPNLTSSIEKEVYTYILKMAKKTAKIE